MPASHALKGASLVLAFVLVAAGAAAMAGADPTDPKPPKPTSLAPHPTTKRAFGTPIKPPILHKRHKQGAPATGSQATATPSTSGKQATISPSAKPDEAPK
jgi:hypothetical protein